MVESANLTQESWIAPTPFVVVKLVSKEFHFDERLALRMEVTAGITAKILDLIINAFGQVGGAQMGMGGGGVFDEGEVIGGARFQVFDPGFIVGPQLVQ